MGGYYIPSQPAQLPDVLTNLGRLYNIRGQALENAMHSLDLQKQARALTVQQKLDDIYNHMGGAAGSSQPGAAMSLPAGPGGNSQPQSGLQPGGAQPQPGMPARMPVLIDRRTGLPVGQTAAAGSPAPNGAGIQPGPSGAAIQPGPALGQPGATAAPQTTGVASAFSGPPDPSQALMNGLRGTGTPEGWAAAQTIEQQLQGNQKAQLDLAKQRVDTAGQLFNAVTDQRSYDTARTTAQKYGIVQPGELPPLYDPATVSRYQAQAQTVSEHLTAAQAQANAAETALHNTATEGQAQADLAEKTTHDAALLQQQQNTSSMNGKALQLYQQRSLGLPLSTQDTAWLKAWEHVNDLTKVQPGVMRAQIYANTVPVQVVDPNNPDVIRYAPRSQAIAQGMVAPGSGPAHAARATDTYMTTGKGGQALTAFNTAQQHLQVLGQAADALKNGDITLFNQIGNSYAKATGSPAPTNFDAVKNAVRGEVSRALTGNVTVAEQGDLEKDFNNASSPAQIAGVVQKYTQLMEGKKNALRDQYNAGRQGQPAFDATHWSQQPASALTGAPGAAAGAPPAGATMKVPGNDGKMHWSDGKNDLGVAQ